MMPSQMPSQMPVPMRLAAAIFFPALLCATAQLHGQSQSHRLHSDDLGTVTGHITCSDTQRPARLAWVRLVPVTPPTVVKGIPEEFAAAGELPPVETDMAGAYTLRNVTPGDYYLRVDYDGYITPLVAFTSAQLAKPTPDVQQRIQQELQLVSVAARTTTQADTVIQRGAAISGTVTYDDGSPAIGIMVHLLRPNAKGEFRDQYNPMGGSVTTDAKGMYRVEDLPPGKYVVEANLTMSEQSFSTMPGPDGHTTVQLNVMRYTFALPIYSGSALRRREAVKVDAIAGQQIADINLAIPLSKLHPVSGSLLAQDGHTINGGSVELLHADDRDQLASVDISNEDQQFHFPYVPEDDYIVSVPAAKDVMQVEVPNAKGTTPATHTEDKTVKTYAPAEQPLKVETDTTGVVISVPDKPTTAAPAGATN